MKPLSLIILPHLAAAMLLTASSCRQEICYDHEGLTEISVAYEQEWERDYGAALAGQWDENSYGTAYEALRPAPPTSITMVAYPTDGTTPYNLYLPATGGSVSSFTGGALLFYNDDTECVVIDDIASHPDATATTTGRSRSSLTPMHEGERSVNAPDVLYGAFIEHADGPDSHTTTPLSITMRPLVYTYLIRYKISQGAEYVSLARGALAGMAEKVRLRDGSTTADAATVLFDSTLDAASSTVTAIVNTFGVPSHPGYTPGAESVTPEGPFTLNLEVLLNDGSIQTFDFDVTRQMLNQPRGGVITVGSIHVINNSTQVDSGFDVDVDDWGEYEDVILPPFET